jgi:hypothetical protein
MTKGINVNGTPCGQITRIFLFPWVEEDAAVGGNLMP